MNQLFSIVKLTEEEVRKIEASPNEPHTHDFEELIIGIEGSLEHFIDFRSEEVCAPYISYVTKGKVHRVRPGVKKGKAEIWLIRFKSEFIPEITFHLYYYYHLNSSFHVDNGVGFEMMVNLCRMMDEESRQKVPSYAAIAHLLSALFIKIEAERGNFEPEDGNLIKTQNITFKNFLIILEENFTRPVGVDYYADRLFMSARNLNLICQHILQQSVSEIIETRKLIEAKKLLVTTDKSVSEIGFELGYNEKSYFTSVFKKKAGQTPTEFREEMRALIS
jgi:AraC-like DNA-binding protein